MTKARDLANLISTGNIFSDGAIAASEVTGLAASATVDTTNAGNITSGTFSAARLPAFSGDATSVAGTSALTLTSSGVVAGTYGSSTAVPVVTVDAKGRLTTVSTSAISGSLTFTGDVTGTGTTGTSTALTLANSGVVAGTYGSSTAVPVVVVDSKGRVTGLSTQSISGSLNFTGDVTGTGTTGSSTSLTLANSGVVAGTYTKVTVDAKGRATSGTTLVASDIPNLDASKITSGTIDAARLPSYVDDVLEFANLASFPGTGETGKIYLALDTNKAYRWSGSAYVYITSGAVDSVAGRTGVVTLTSSDVGLGLVENKSSATIRSEITSANVTTALGFTPYNSTNPSGYITNSALTPYLTTATASSTYLPLAGGTLSGQLVINAAGVASSPTLRLNTSSSSTFVHTQENLATNLTAGQHAIIVVGKEANTKNSGYIGYTWAGAGSNSNYVTIGHWGADDLFRVYGDGTVTVGTNAVLHAANYTNYSVSVYGQSHDTVSADSLGNSTATGGFYTISAGTAGSFSGSNDQIIHIPYANTAWAHQIATTWDTGTSQRMAFRTKHNGTWQAWRTVLSDGNYNSYSPTLTGGNASGTWGISITGNAATSTSAGNASGADQLNTDTNSKASALQYWQTVNNTALNPSNDYHYAIRMSHGDAETYYSATLALNFFSDTLSFRRKVNGTNQSWRTILHDGNYSSYALPLSGGSVSGAINLTSRNNGVLVNSSGTGSADAAIAIQQVTGEGWTGIFVDYEPYAGWGLWHDNPNNYFSFTAETSTGGIRSFTVPSRSSGNRTAYEKVRIDQNNGDVLVGGNLTVAGNQVLHASNYNSYSPTLTGSGASGTWGINITGNSATTSQRSFSGDIASSGQGRFTGWYSDGAGNNGLAAEIGVSGGAAYILSYNRSTGSYGTLAFNATNIQLVPQGGALTTTGGNVILHAGNYTSYSPSLTGSGASGTWSISISGTASTASQVGGYTSDGWLRKVGDSTQFQMYGNTRTMIYRTDGVTNPHGGGSYAHIFYYGGSSDNQRMFIINTDGRLYSPYHGWLDTLNTSGSAASLSNTSGYLVGRAAISESSLDTTTATGIYAVSKTGHSSSLLVWNVGGSTGPVQLDTNYFSDIRYRSQTDSSSWNAWKTIIHSANYSSYAVPLTGGTMSGRLTTTAWTTSGRNYSNEWIQFDNYSGLYSPNNGAHFYPNNGSYGGWRSAGSRNGWGGIEFDASNGNVVLMINNDSNTSGFHNNSYGWQMRWNNGVGYIHKNAYGGGTAAVILDSVNYTNYITPASDSGPAFSAF